jgi:hypothetical protein
MFIRKRVLALLLGGVIAATAWGEDKVVTERPLAATLKAKTQAVKAGEVPVFLLTIQNRGKSPERLIDARQKNLQSVLYNIEVRNNGRLVELPTAMPGLPLLDDESYVTLKPGDKIEFEMTKFALRLRELPPGRYEARIIYSNWPKEGKLTLYESPSAEFTVEK